MLPVKTVQLALNITSVTVRLPCQLLTLYDGLVAVVGGLNVCSETINLPVGTLINPACEIQIILKRVKGSLGLSQKYHKRVKDSDNQT